MAFSPGALNGVRVLDFTWALAGPFGTMILADLGACVAKVEPPDGVGHSSRTNPPFVDGLSLYFASIHRGKRGMVLDLKNPAGRELALALADKADVVAENFTPGVAERLGLGYETLAARNPRLVYASCAGFGQTGSWAARSGVDGVIQAVSGLMSITGEPDGPPVRVGYSIGDLAAGLYLAIGVLGALYEREQSGLGQYLDISMFECQFALLENAVTRFVNAGEIPRRLGSTHPIFPMVSVFATRDGGITLSSLDDKGFKRICTAVGKPEWADDPRFSSEPARREHRVELRETIEAHLRTQDSSYWVERLQNAEAMCAPVNTIPEAVEMPPVIERGVLQETVDGQGRRVKVVGSPLRLSRTPAGPQAGAPLYGEHVHELLADWLGLGDADIQILAQQGAFGAWDPGHKGE
jgi:CoA:oxalate CoA-transferase